MQALNRRFCMVVVIASGLIAALPALSASKEKQQVPQSPTKQGEQQNAGAGQVSDGEVKFKQNCSRCHEAPQTLSPHISGTVLRHMRVRASLSQQDERDILKFLNP
jgi:cytochrome c5